MDGPRPSSFAAPSIWYADVDAPHTNPLGKRRVPAAAADSVVDVGVESGFCPGSQPAVITSAPTAAPRRTLRRVSGRMPIQRVDRGKRLSRLGPALAVERGDLVGGGDRAKRTDRAERGVPERARPRIPWRDIGVRLVQVTVAEADAVVHLVQGDPDVEVFGPEHRLDIGR